MHGLEDDDTVVTVVLVCSERGVGRVQGRLGTR